MLTRRSEKRLLHLCMAYFVYVFCYGIAVKLTIGSDLLFQLKTIVPEAILLLVCGECLAQRRLHMDDAFLLLLGYAGLILLTNWMLHGLNSQALYLVRDIYIPLLTLVLLSSVGISAEGIDDFLCKMTSLMKLYLLAGFALAAVQQMKGWAWTARFYTGYTFYEQDPVSKVKVVHYLTLLRAPSLSGNFATFGYYCLIANGIVRARTQGTWQRCFWDGLTLACLVLATNKSAIVAWAAMLFMGGRAALRSPFARRMRWIWGGLAAAFLLAALLFIGGESEATAPFASLLTRFDVWEDIFSQVHPLELLFPFRQFLYGSGAEGSVSFWDNTYLYSLFTQGIIGTFLWWMGLKRQYDRAMQRQEASARAVVCCMTVVLLVLALTVNVTQGRGFFSPYLLLMGILCSQSELGNSSCAI